MNPSCLVQLTGRFIRSWEPVLRASAWHCFLNLNTDLMLENGYRCGLWCIKWAPKVVWITRERFTRGGMLVWLKYIARRLQHQKTELGWWCAEPASASWCSWSSRTQASIIKTQLVQLVRKSKFCRWDGVLRHVLGVINVCGKYQLYPCQVVLYLLWRRTGWTKYIVLLNYDHNFEPE